MSLPTPDLYNDAVQSPRLAFTDSELQAAKAECNGSGLPKALGGGFAITYHLEGTNGKSFAVRCFHKEVRDLQDRYGRISSCLTQLRSPLFVSFQYLPTGIKVNGKHYPIVKMEWVNGTTLGEYVEQNIANRAALESLRQSFARMQVELASFGIAHGDIQNGNVLVGSQGKLSLIDYDGLYVPGMAEGGGTELGHKNFQHPDRSAIDFSKSIDRFSFLLVDLSLWALTLGPSLFQRFSTGENILFSANDLADPSSSQVFDALKAIPRPAFQRSLAHFEAICRAPISAVPMLADFLAGQNVPALTTPSPASKRSPQKYIAALPVVDAKNYSEVCKHIGDRVELIGKVVTVSELKTNKGKPYVFINFGNEGAKYARITIWPPALRTMTQKPNASWAGRWLAFTCLVEPINRRGGVQSVGPTLSKGMQVYTISEDEALWRLARGVRPNAPPLPTSKPSLTTKNSDLLKELRAKGLQGRPRTPATQVIRPSTNPKSHPTQQAIPTSLEAKNEAILRSLQQSSSGQQTVSPSGLTNSTSVNTQGASGRSMPPSRKTGCLVFVASFFALIVLSSTLVFATF